MAGNLLPYVVAGNGQGYHVVMALLGDLEQAVMDILWRRREPMSVREVHEELSAERDLAYTTVMTVLDRLAKKGTAVRELDGRAWRYRAAKPRADLMADEILIMLNSGTPEQRTAVWTAVQRRMREQPAQSA